jgi:hypothetical protein
VVDELRVDELVDFLQPAALKDREQLAGDLLVLGLGCHLSLLGRFCLIRRCSGASG